MYNRDVKELFAKELPAYSVLMQYFKKTEEFEQRFSCDIGEMSFEQIEEVIRNTFSSVPRKSYLIHFKHRLKKYADWYSAEFSTKCICRDIDKVFNIIQQNDPYDFFNVSEKLYFQSARYLILEMNRISTEDSSLLVKSAEILAWYGLKDTEMLRIKKADIDNGYIYFNGRKMKTDRFSSEILEKFRDIEEYTVAVNGGNGTMYFASSPFLFRKRARNPLESNEPIKMQNLRCEVAALSMKSKYNLGLNQTYINGIMSRAFIKEWEGDVPELQGKEYYEQLFDVKMKKGTFENLIDEYVMFKKFINKL
ncbi:MAG: hypothetical protein ACI4I9_08870 [Porcipelethomonas sp.]